MKIPGVVGVAVIVEAARRQVAESKADRFCRQSDRL